MWAEASILATHGHVRAAERVVIDLERELGWWRRRAARLVAAEGDDPVALVSIRDAARAARCCMKTVRRAIGSGDLEVVGAGTRGARLLRGEDVVVWASNRRGAR